MKIQLNGESRGIGVGQTVAGLLQELDIGPIAWRLN